MLAEGVKALADPTRLRLRNLLRHGGLGWCGLTECLELPQTLLEVVGDPLFAMASALRVSR